MLKVSLFRRVHNAFHDCVGYSIKRFKKRELLNSSYIKERHGNHGIDFGSLSLTARDVNLSRLL